MENSIYDIHCIIFEVMIHQENVPHNCLHLQTHNPLTNVICLMQNFSFKQECIPVRCVSTAVVAATRCQYRGVSALKWVGLPQPPPPLNRQVLLKTLPSLAVGKNKCYAEVFLIAALDYS